MTPDPFVIGHDSDVVCVALFSRCYCAAMTITTTNPWKHYDLYRVSTGDLLELLLTTATATNAKLGRAMRSRSRCRSIVVVVVVVEQQQQQQQQPLGREGLNNY